MRKPARLAAERQDHQRQRDEQRRPQADAQRAPHHARIARAERLRRQWRHGGYETEAECERDEENRLPERRRRNRFAAEPADERQIGRCHRDLPELRHGQRRREFQRFREFFGDMTTRPRRRAGAIPLASILSSEVMAWN